MFFDELINLLVFRLLENVKMPIAISQRPKWRIQTSCFVWLTVQRYLMISSRNFTFEEQELTFDILLDNWR